MKILILQDDVPPQARGGAGMIAAAQARALARAGHEVVVLAAVQECSLAGDVLEDGVRVVRVYSRYHPRWRAWRSLYNPPLLAALRRLLAEVHPQIVHAHNIHEHISFYALRLARQSGAKVFLTAHDAMTVAYGQVYPVRPVCGAPWDTSLASQLRLMGLRFNPARTAFIRFSVRSCARVLAVSDALGKLLAGCGIARVSVLHNGIDPSEWEVTPTEVESFKEHRGLLGKRVVFFAGRMSHAKGGAVALACMELVRKSLPNAILVVAGWQTRQQAHTVALGLLSRKEMACAYRASDVVMVPSLYLDPFPTVNLEAGACGKPVVATCFGGSPEAVVDGETGYIENPYDTAAFAARIIELLSNPEHAARLGEAARERMQRHFSLKAQTRKLLEFYTGA